MARPMANDPPFATLNHFTGDLGIPSESDSLRIGIRGHVPKKGEIIEAADAGKIIKARIDACHKNPPIGGSSPVFFKVLASEI